MKNRYIVIMAGGAGTRFWPLSRDAKPKQFLDILNTGTTLLQDTIMRFRDLCPRENIFVVTNESYRELVMEQVDIPEENILCEPMRRNTAPCILYAAFRIHARDPEAVMLVSPADHLIKETEEFRKVIEEGFEFAGNNDVLLTLGMKPDRPETGYGYIQANTKIPVPGYKSLMKVKTFTEKPNRELAEIFLKSGDFYWNSGIFLWKVKSILTAFEVYLPDMHSTFDLHKQKLGTEEEGSIITRIYSECLSISIDYGVMEKADNVYVKCTNFGWSDLGTWGSVSEHNISDRNGNTGNMDSVFAYELKNSIVKMPEGKIAVIQGLKDYIVVDSGDVLLIMQRSEEQDIKKYISDIRDKMGEDYL
ncbi:MAG: NTP transferase domain-containing protein [Bacteroidales bacterium]|nr:NTP transferase domain-containing protein [Bacteroidales bacterium]